MHLFHSGESWAPDTFIITEDPTNTLQLKLSAQEGPNPAPSPSSPSPAREGRVHFPRGMCKESKSEEHMKLINKLKALVVL